MLSREVMGILALAILWVNTLLVIGAALQELAAIARRRRRYAPLGDRRAGVGLVEGRVGRGDGPGGALARHLVDQVGRYAADDDDARAIAFTDRSYEGEVLGGSVQVGEETIAIEAVERAAPAVPGRAGTVEIWPRAEAVRAAAACPSSARFSEAYGDARKARGFARTVATPIEEGEPVWIFGELVDGAGSRSIRPAPGAPPDTAALLVASIDPRAVCSRAMALLAAGCIGVLAAAAICTALALWSPPFGLVSTIGGALGLAYFLLVQPAGTALRDAVRPPSRAELRGHWKADPRATAIDEGATASASERQNAVRKTQESPTSAAGP